MTPFADGRAWERREGERATAAFVPLCFAPGEAYQFDWSHEMAQIDGVTTKVKVAQVRLCHSRMPFARAYLREAPEMVFMLEACLRHDAHEKAFQFFKIRSSRSSPGSKRCCAKPPSARSRRHGSASAACWATSPQPNARTTSGTQDMVQSQSEHALNGSF